MVIEELILEDSIEEIFDRFYQQEHCFFLDSSMEHARLGRYSYLGANPFLILSSKGEEIQIEDMVKKECQRFLGNPYEALRSLMKPYEAYSSETFPFTGGAVGHFSYDFCHEINKNRALHSMPAEDLEVADCWFGVYDGILVIDHFNQGEDGLRCYLVAHGIWEDCQTGIERLRRIIETPLQDAGTEPFKGREIGRDMSKEAYVAAVDRIREYIRSGDVYQVNMTQRFHSEFSGGTNDLYRRLRRANGAPFAGYLACNQYEILSSSPERFLKIQNGEVETRPIKGTCPRGSNPTEDARYLKELLASEKNQSELLMIVDLERNDLGKTAATGSVQVTELFYPETYATVHHLVATVTSTLSNEHDLFDCIQGAFPGGSITGAPKIRAMEIIQELEPYSRDVYTGSMGYLGFQGTADLNILIRTILCVGQNAYFHSGGGIVWDSDPEAEYEETFHKARALMKVLEGRGTI